MEPIQIKRIVEAALLAASHPLTLPQLSALFDEFDMPPPDALAKAIEALQEDCADHVLAMLKGAMRELCVSNPDLLSTDVGPVIDAQAGHVIRQHIDAMRAAGHAVAQIELHERCRHGTFVPPTLIEIDSLDELQREVFGPVLHVLRYRRDELDALLGQINATGYGLTFGVHTRIDETVHHVTERVHAGNLYVNRNVVGAVVGVQPFGGEGLSGTGPKAGGPLYLYRLLSMRPESVAASIESAARGENGVTLARPTGELNTYRLVPRGRVLGIAATQAGAQAQWRAAQSTGNALLLLDTPEARAWHKAQGKQAKEPSVKLIAEAQIDSADFEAVLFEGDSDALRAWNRRVAARPGAIVSVQGLSSDTVAAGTGYATERLYAEKSLSINTAAAGGNASLMTIG